MTSNGDAMASDEDVQAFCDLLQTMKDSMLATRDLVKSLREKCVPNTNPALPLPG